MLLDQRDKFGVLHWRRFWQFMLTSKALWIYGAYRTSPQAQLQAMQNKTMLLVGSEIVKVRFGVRPA